MIKVFITFVFALMISSSVWAGNSNTKSKNKPKDLDGVVLTNDENKVQKGNVALLDTTNNRLVEIDLSGKTLWTADLPKAFRNQRNLNGGSDIEWLEVSDTFLVAVPNTGFFEINRAGKVLTECKNKFISHDIDKLNDGSFVFVNGWDDKGEDEPIITKVSSDCNVLWTKTRDFFQVEKSDLNNRFAKDKSILHANSIRILPNEDIMVSIRNYDQVIIIRGNEILKRFKNAPGVHDPSEVYIEDNGTFFYYANRARPHQIIKRNFENPDDTPEVIWTMPRDSRKEWSPLRTVQKLDNGNWLITGSKNIGQITPSGDLVWEIHFPEFRHQRETKKKATYIFKAAFVAP